MLSVFLQKKLKMMRNERDMKLLKWVQSYVVSYAYDAKIAKKNKEIDAKQKAAGQC